VCGIAGWFSRTPNESPQQAALQRMVERIHHRGPDGQGSCLLPHAALGHTRLAIIDLESGQQPMASHDQRFQIIFNGEIYNYQALREQLLEQGHQFLTHSDTEVIIELFRAHGVDGFSRLRGMFAFALWDGHQQQGYLVRDPLGIKPLFIRHEADGITFASEAKAILARHDQQAELNTEALHLLMNFRYLPGERSLFKGISQLAPGEIVTWCSSGDTQHHRLPAPTPQARSPLTALEESVALHCTADVEVGAYLSGGIDSAAIVQLAKQQVNRPLRTFTLQAGDDPNEAINARRSAELLGVENQQGAIDCHIPSQLTHLLWHLEAPKINALQVSLLAKLTSQQVKVTLSGLGGDELFYGYNAHKIMLQAARAGQWLPGSVSQALGQAGQRITGLFSKPLWSEPERAMAMLRRVGDWPQVYGLLRNVWDSPGLRQKIYGPRMLEHPLPDAFGEIQQRWPDEPDPVSALAQFERQNKLVNDLLWQEDRVSMAEGLEVRVPFMDSVLIAEITQFSRQQLMPQGQAKGYLKQLLAQQLPPQILNRPKSGFQVFAPQFFHQHLKPMAEHYLSREYTMQLGLFNPKFISDVLQQKPRTGLRWHYFILYLMLLTHLWIELFEQGHATINLH